MYGHGTISKIKHLNGKKLKSKAQCKLCMHTKLQALYIHTCTCILVTCSKIPQSDHVNLKALFIKGTIHQIFPQSPFFCTSNL